MMWIFDRIEYMKQRVTKRLTPQSGDEENDDGNIVLQQQLMTEFTSMSEILPGTIPTSIVGALSDLGSVGVLLDDPTQSFDRKLILPGNGTLTVASFGLLREDLVKYYLTNSPGGDWFTQKAIALIRNKDSHVLSLPTQTMKPAFRLLPWSFKIDDLHYALMKKKFYRGFLTMLGRQYARRYSLCTTSFHAYRHIGTLALFFRGIRVGNMNTIAELCEVELRRGEPMDYTGYSMFQRQLNNVDNICRAMFGDSDPFYRHSASYGTDNHRFP